MAVSLHQMVAAWRLWQEIDRQTFLVSIAYSAIGAAITMVPERNMGGIQEDALPYSRFIL